jgi:hypothetical protein
MQEHSGEEVVYYCDFHSHAPDPSASSGAGDALAVAFVEDRSLDEAGPFASAAFPFYKHVPIGS